MTNSKLLLIHNLEACYTMKPLMILTAMTVIGLFGIIGTVEYAHAEIYHLDIKDYVNIDNCLTNSTKYIDILYGDYIYLTHSEQGQYNLMISGINDNRDVFSFFKEDIHTTNILVFYESNYYTVDYLGHYGENKFTVEIHRNFDDDNEKWINCNAELIIRTHLNIPDEPVRTQADFDEKWKSKYNTCFDKKENLKNDLSEYRTELNTLDIYKQNLTNANFEIDKLKQEKADLIKKVETLETQLQEN